MKNKILFYFFSLFVYLFLVVSPASASETNILACNNFYGGSYNHDLTPDPLWIPADRQPGYTFGLTETSTLNRALVPLSRTTARFDNPQQYVGGEFDLYANVYHGADIIATSTLQHFTDADDILAISPHPLTPMASSTWWNFHFPDGVAFVGGDNTYRIAIRTSVGFPTSPNFFSEQSYPCGDSRYITSDTNAATVSVYFYEGSATLPQPPAIKVAVILSEPYGKPHISTPVTAQPCKLIPEKTYPNGHSQEYFNDLLFCVNDYYRENSYGAVSFDFTIFDKEGEWYKITDSAKTESYYADGRELEFITDAIAEATGDFIPANFDVVSVVHAGIAANNESEGSVRMDTQVSGTPAVLPYKTILASDDGVGGWAHELGHIIGALTTPSSTFVPDLSNAIAPMGNVEQWDLMARGSRNRIEKNPPNMSSYVKEFLGWLDYDIHPKSDYGTYQIEALGTKQIGDDVFRYNLEDHTNDNTTTPYYILESRNSGVGQWDESVPENALVLYYVNPLGFEEYGYTDVGGKKFINNQCRTINIPDTGYSNDGILEASESYGDYDRLVSFEAVSFSPSSTASVSIQPISENGFSAIFFGMILDPLDVIYKSSCKLSTVGNSLESGSKKPLAQISEKNEPRLIFSPVYALPSERIIFKLDKIRYKTDRYIEVFAVRGVIDPRYIVIVFISIFATWTILRRFGKNNAGLTDKICTHIKNFIRPDFLKVIIFSSLAFVSQEFALDMASYFHFGPYVIQLELLPSNAAINVAVWYFTACALSVLVRKIKVKYLIMLFVIAGASMAGPQDFVQNKADTVAAPLASSTAPDLDLHAITSSGLHVGVNYQTGEYESQVAGTIASGDNQGAPEWILLPEGTDAKFYVSSRDNQDFLSANPDIASQLATTTDSYELFARYIDPDSGIFTSETLPNETISPGSTTTYDILGTSSPEVIREITLTPTADSYLKKGSPNQNFGSDTILNVRGDGKRRTLVQFDEAAISNAVGTGTILSASLELNIVDGSTNNWGSVGRLVGAYRLTHSWTESGVTWNCSNDTNTSNSSPNCTGDTWQMEENDLPSWAGTPIDEKLITNGLSGIIKWDVTADAQAFLTGTQNYGWILRKAIDTQSGDVEFGSKESIKQPKLILRIK